MADRLNEVTDMQRPVAVSAVELVPIAWKVDLTLPLPRQRCLAISSVSRDNDRATVVLLVKPIDETGAS